MLIALALKGASAMPNYQKMYYVICAAASHVLDILPVTVGNMQARLELESALLEAEDIYIDTSSLIQLPTAAEAGAAVQEEDILARLRACDQKDKQTALQMLDAYLRTLSK